MSSQQYYTPQQYVTVISENPKKSQKPKETYTSEHDISTQSKCNNRSKPITWALIFFIILVILGFLLNLILLFRIPNFNKLGIPIENDAKITSAVMGFGFTLFFGSLFGGFVYYHYLKCNYINGWVMLFFAIMVAIIITYIAALLMGEWINIEHLWFSNTLIPVNPPNPPIPPPTQPIQ